MRRSLMLSRRILGSVLLLAALLGTVLWLASNTAPGRAFIERLTYRLTAGHVKLTGLGGTLPSRLQLVRLELIDDGGKWLTADQVSLRWSPLALLQGRIRVQTLQVSHVSVERTPRSDQKNSGGSLPHIDIARFAVGALELGAPLVGTPATLSLEGSLQLRSLQDASADVEARRQGGAGSYAMHLRLDPKRIDASLALSEPGGGPLENLISLPGLGALAATVGVHGPRAAEQVDLVLGAGDLHAEVRGSVDLVHESADLDYTLQAPAMSPRPDLAWSMLALRGNWHGSLSAARAEGRLDLKDVQVPGGVRLSQLRAALEADGGKVGLRGVIEDLEIPGSQPRLLAAAPLKIDAALQLNAAARPLELTATHPLFTLHARAETAGDAARRLGTIELDLADLAPLAAYAAQDVRGNAVIKAQLAHAAGENALELTAAAGFTGGSASWLPLFGSRTTLQLSGTMADDGIKVRNLRLAGETLSLAASGSAALAAGHPDVVKDLQARWQVAISDLSRLSAGVAGDLNASGRLAGASASLSSDAQLTAHLAVHGSTSGTLQAAVHAQGLPKAPSGTVEAHGLLDGAPLSVDASLDRSSGDAHVLVRRADWKSAHVSGDLTADAALARSHGQLRLQIGQLGDFDRLLGVNVAGNVEAALGFLPAQGRTEANLELDGRNLSVGQLAGNVHLQAKGPADAIGLELSAQLPQFQGAAASLTAAALLNLGSHELRIGALSAGYRNETLRLLSPAQLSFANGLAIDDLKIGADEAILDVAGELMPALDARVSLQHVGPALINGFAPGLLAAGTFEASSRLQGQLSNPNGSFSLTASGVRFADDAAAELPPVDLQARAALGQGAASVNATLTAGTGSKLKASGTAPLSSMGALDLQLGGDLDVGLVNPLLEARGLHAGGRLAVDATVTGTATAPRLGGGIMLAGGSLRDYVRGINLSDIKARLAGSEGTLQIKSFAAKASSGSVDMTGTFGVLQPGMPLDLKILAKNARPLASSIITANLDADIRLSGKATERLDVGGTIHVNKATVGIPDQLPPDVAVLDVRRRGTGATPPAGKPLVIGIDLVIQAPQEVLVQGRGLDAELGGEIRLSGTTDDLQAGGGLEVQRGSFTLAGTRLNFTTDSRVSFDGAGLSKKIDPTLDFTAQTTLTDGSTVTLHITGFADAPIFSLTSSSGLPQDEIMAQLLFGENAAQLSALQIAQIAAALATLSGVGGSGPGPLVKLQRSLGLDRLSVGANTTTSATGATENSGAAIEAGRYISKRVYIEGRQTTTGTSQVQVDVDLTKHLKLQTRLGNGTAITQGTTPENDPGSSIGLSYQFEY